jgi:hypothetical protein
MNVLFLQGEQLYRRTTEENKRAYPHKKSCVSFCTFCTICFQNWALENKRSVGCSLSVRLSAQCRTQKLLLKDIARLIFSRVRGIRPLTLLSIVRVDVGGFFTTTPFYAAKTMDNNSERVGDSGGSGELKKTAKLTAITDSSGADAQRRLVEYFVVISSVEQKEKKKSEKGEQNSNDLSFADWKTESYDDNDSVASGRSNKDVKNNRAYDSDDESVNSAAAARRVKFRPTLTARYPLHDHPDNPLHENVAFFCHPSGIIAVRLEPFMPKVREVAHVPSQFSLFCSLFNRFTTL